MSEPKFGYAVFKPRARLLKLIGEELISDEVVAVTELVKNAHDADASTAIVSFRGVTSPRGEIVVHDDGVGMDRETFLGGWMEPAGSTKGDAGSRKTRRGRRVLGEKGVGRFAADKLGRYLELISRRAGHNAEVRAEFDWDQFDTDDEMLSNIKHRWEIRPATEIPNQGTILKIGGLRQIWTERMFKRLSTRLSRLQSPFGSQHGFTIKIETDEFPDYSGELRSTILDKAPYSFGLAFDGRDSFRVDIGERSRVVPAPQSAGQITCGPVTIRLYAFDLETDALARIGPRHEVRAWLREWSGVSVYRDGFRIWPYGEPHDDWLRLDQRRVNNPVVCLSNNQVVGFVNIGRDRNPQLLDQTNREGLIHNQAFADLRRIMEHAFQLLEDERQHIRRPDGGALDARRSRIVEPILGVLQSITTLAESKVPRDLRKVAAQARRSIEQEQQRIDRLLRGFTDLAATGEAAIAVGETLVPLLEKLRSELRTIRRSPAAQDSGNAEKTLDEIAGHLAFLAALASGDSHKRRTMDVASELEAFRTNISPVLAQRSIRVSVKVPKHTLLLCEMNPTSFRKVLQLLATNSADWLLRTSDPRVTIKARAFGNHCEIMFSDNGPGIRKDLAVAVFEPMFTMKEGGRGMGLTIARGLIEQNSGTIEVTTDRRRTGANIRVLLPRKRTRSTTVQT